MASLRSKTEQYQALPAKVSQQVFRGLDKNWPSFFAAAKVKGISEMEFSLSIFDYTFTNYQIRRGKM